MTNGEKYTRADLNGEGCVFGRNLATRFDTWQRNLEEELKGLKGENRTRMDKLEKKLDRLTWALVSVAITLATASLTLWITHLGP